jgi:hypothetical protein
MSVQDIPNEAPQVADSNGHDLYILLFPKLCNHKCLLCFFDSTERLYPSDYKKIVSADDAKARRNFNYLKKKKK